MTLQGNQSLLARGRERPEGGKPARGRMACGGEPAALALGRLLAFGVLRVRAPLPCAVGGPKG